jgi:hypothetical protein
MMRKIITALVTVSASTALLLTLSGCGPAESTNKHPVQAVPASKPKPDPKKCTPGYSPCLPPRADYDCSDIDGRVFVTGSDPYWLDRDSDGVGCDV